MRLLLVVVAVGENAAEQGIWERIVGIEGCRSIGAEIIGSGRVVYRIDAHVACHVLDINAGLQGVRSLNPSHFVRDGLNCVGSSKRPAWVVAKHGDIRNALTR